MILLGASVYPNNRNLQSDAAAVAFRASHQGVKQYFTDPNGFSLIEEESLLDLFDSDQYGYSQLILERISAWLKRQVGNSTDGTPVSDVIIYYIGHGGFRDNSKEYFLAVSRTTDEDPFHTSIDIESLAKSLKRHAGKCRRFLFLDACFAGAALRGFQGTLEELVRLRNEEVSWSDAEAKSGTALLCSSSKDTPSVWQSDGTMFTSGLLKVLTQSGVKAGKSRVSLKWLLNQTWKVLHDCYHEEAVRPQLHSPDTEDGNIADIELFPLLSPVQGQDNGAAARKTKNRPQPKEQRFREIYNKSCTDAMMIVRRLRDYDVEELARAQTSLVSIIRAVIVIHYDEGDTLQINANVMVPAPIKEREVADFPGLHFLDPKRAFSTYDGVLVTHRWANDAHCSPGNFSIPFDVADEEEDAILGAPRAFVSGSIQLVTDIQNGDFMDKLLWGQPARVARQVKKYFAARTSFRSFVSIPLQDREEVVGVLNVQSNAIGISGKNSVARRRMLEDIEPFCTALAAVTAEIRKRGATDPKISDSGEE